MGNYTILQMFENPRRGRKARNFTTNAPKVLDLKSSSEQIFTTSTAVDYFRENRKCGTNLLFPTGGERWRGGGDGVRLA